VLILHYKTKKELRKSIGKHLKYSTTTFRENEYRSNGEIIGMNRPTGIRRNQSREWFAKVLMRNDKIIKVK